MEGGGVGAFSLQIQSYGGLDATVRHGAHRTSASETTPESGG